MRNSTRNLVMLPLVAALALVVATGCRPRPQVVNYPPDIRRVTGVGVMHVAPQPAPQPAYVPPPPPAAPVDYSLSGSVTAVGTGAPNPGMAPAQARLMARRAAITDARRNLLEMVKGVQVASQTTVANFMTQSDVITSQVNGYLQGAEVINEQELPDGSVEVTMQIALNGVGTILNTHAPRQAPVMAPPPQPAQPSAPVMAGPQQAQARAMAKRAAEMDAQRQLLELAKGVRLQSGTTVQNMMLQDDRIRGQVEGIIRGARTVDTRYLPDGTVEVDMEFDLNSVRYNVR